MRILLAAIASMAVVLIVFTIYLIVPLFSSDTEVAPAAPVTEQVGDPATAARIPTQPLAVAESFSVFDGTDPTVFESGSDNPVRFENDPAGAYSRVSSSASASGVRVIVGPGLASRASGQTIRVTVVARSSRENGAAGFRFAYQSGLAISHWQRAELTSEYAAFGLVWRVPAMRTDPAGDAILIEPGIPGDGTAADIQSIKIDVLAPDAAPSS